MINKIREEIANAELDSAFVLTFTLLEEEKLKGTYGNTLEALKSRYSRQKKADQQKVEDPDRIEKNINQITVNFLDVISEIETVLISRNSDDGLVLNDMEPIMHDKRESNNRPKSNWAQIALACIGILTFLFSFKIIPNIGFFEEKRVPEVIHQNKSNDDKTIAHDTNSRTSGEPKSKAPKEPEVKSSELNRKEQPNLDYLFYFSAQESDFCSLVTRKIGEFSTRFASGNSSRASIGINYFQLNVSQEFILINLFFRNPLVQKGDIFKKQVNVRYEEGKVSMYYDNEKIAEVNQKPKDIELIKLLTNESFELLEELIVLDLNRIK